MDPSARPDLIWSAPATMLAPMNRPPRRIPPPRPLLHAALLGLVLVGVPGFALAKTGDDTPEALRKAAEEATRERPAPARKHKGAPRAVSPEVQGLITKGNRFYALGEYDGARLQYLEAMRLDPKSPEAHYGLGITYLAMGDVSSAIAAWRRSGDMDTVTANLFDEFGKFRAARDAVRSQLVATRQSQAERLERRDEEASQRYVKKGMGGLLDSSTKAMLGKLDMPQGAPSGEDANVVATYDARAGESLAPKSGGVNDEDLAQDNLPSPAADVPLSVGNVPAPASASHAAPAESAPLPPLSAEQARDPRARGRYYAQAGKPAAAATAFEEVLRTQPDDAEALDYLAALHLASGDMDRAEGEYKRLASLRPADSPPLANLGGIYMDQGRFDEASATLDQALKRNPKDGRALNNLAGVYYKTGRTDEAVKLLERAVQANPDDLNARNNLAGIYYRQEKFDLAIQELQKILEVEPSFGVAAANLEEAIRRKREFADARRTGKMRARQIVVGTQAEAEDLRAQIKGPGDFARLAREKSLDPSASNGGDMGFFSPGDLDDETASAVKRLAPGETSGIVRTPDGYAIIERLN